MVTAACDWSTAAAGPGTDLPIVMEMLVTSGAAQRGQHYTTLTSTDHPLAELGTVNAEYDLQVTLDTG